MQSQSLKTKFFKTIVALYVTLGLLVYIAFHVVTLNIVRHLGGEFATKQALLEKSKLMSAVEHDLSLSVKMADSPILSQWAQHESNPALRKYATEELKSYQRVFTGHSLFFAVDRSGHYYFDDGSTDHPFAHPRYTLNPNNLNDAWYFKTMRSKDNFELNVDHDNHLNVTKLWFNVAIENTKGHKIGLCGGAINITDFINDIVKSKESGVETILFRKDGAITGDRNPKYVLHNSKVRGTEKLVTIYDLLGSSADRMKLRKALADLGDSSNQVKTLYLTVDGKSYLAAIASLKLIHWYNLVLVNPAHFVSSSNFLPILVILVLSTLAVIAAIALLLNQLVLAPLSALADSSEEIARGNFDIQMPIHSEDEIGLLTNSFNAMTRMVKDHTENLESMVRARTEELDRSNRQLAESNRQIMDSIRFAQLIQASILPEDAAIRHHVEDFFVIHQPRDIVGGDFYYFRPMTDGCLLGVIDCTGHGVPGAFMTMTAKAVLDRVIDEGRQNDPAVILKEYNRLMQATLHHENSRDIVDHGLEIGLCHLVPTEGRIVFAGAKIDLLVVNEGKIKTIRGDKQAVGYRRSNIDYTYTSHPLTPTAGADIYLTSDGILDQAGGNKGWGFGRRRLAELLKSVAAQPVDIRRGSIEEALASYQGDTPQRDDITVIGFTLQQRTAGREKDSENQRPV
ncbi:MAG TPA: SpoIIE family protein phosphatase [Desulfuromonadales bacterium]|nr:SpoIIE family protein phosphatase [Desulfuromonadales bacterium]